MQLFSFSFLRIVNLVKFFTPAIEQVERALLEDPRIELI